MVEKGSVVRKCRLKGTVFARQKSDWLNVSKLCFRIVCFNVTHCFMHESALAVWAILEY